MEVVHTTTFAYSEPVTASYNEARMTPVSDAGQQVQSVQVQVQPTTWAHDYGDYWGTTVTAFEVLEPHSRLVLRARCTVEVGDQPVPDAMVGWTVLGGDEVLDTFAAFLADTETTQVPDDVAALALDAAGGLDPRDAAEAICLAVRDRLDYVPGVTTAHTPAGVAWEARQGVCQDMAHLCAGALRSVGIPARYVSGYVHPRPDAPVGATVEGESHAWVEWWVGGWYGYDPTNRRPAGRDHIVLGRGREYRDVAPLVGVYAGAAGSVLDVTVEITRLR
ncbi:transglutaminase family protein [Cellulosimicrobium arenosum]|uniref:Transglutaminase family protein n=1 Tax=Cellulosimicrobium arenosum TaxID=2708133 RepID=A0A927G600_9MICO|nr:transglutaminase family protein [Cellulosimicrobium arenosum]MBD8077450.1 transglutaminase family protein [Cellulosimicrobium arenosum]